MTTKARVRGEELPPLAGLPLTIKEYFDLAGRASTFGLITRRNEIEREDDPYVAAQWCRALQGPDEQARFERVSRFIVMCRPGSSSIDTGCIATTGMVRDWPVLLSAKLLKLGARFFRVMPSLSDTAGSVIRWRAVGKGIV